MELLKNKSKVIHYSENAKTLSVSLYLGLKKRAYKTLGTLFHLPSVSSVLRYLTGIDCLPGIDHFQISLLKSKIGKKEYDKSCFILIDEMSIKRGLQYDRKKDLVFGYEDDGEYRSSKLANSALFFSGQWVRFQVEADDRIYPHRWLCS